MLTHHWSYEKVIWEELQPVHLTVILQTVQLGTLTVIDEDVFFLGNSKHCFHMKPTEKEREKMALW